MFVLFTTLRRLHWLVALTCGLGPACVIAQTAGELAGDLDAQIVAARDLMGTDITEARALTARVRAEATRLQRLDVRLMADEIDCRILSDSNPEAAEKVAAAGVAAARAVTPVATTNALLRLQACWAGVQIDLGKMKVDDPALTRIVAQAEAPALAPARAMAQLERGLHRSRHGDLLDGQADLLEACGTFTRLGLARDEELCLGHLANHYKRMGDFTEALRLLRQLEEAAQARGARVDHAIYVHGRALVHAAMEAWPDARDAFELAERLTSDLRDDAGRAYALEGVADALLHLGGAREALPRVERALQLLAPLNDPGGAINMKLLLVKVLRANGDAARAIDVLASVRDEIAASGTEYQQTEWFETDAEAQAHLGHWQRAYDSLAQWRKLVDRRHAQQLSANDARLRMQFNRERDAAELQAMQQLNAQAGELRNAQTAVAVLSIVLALGTLAFAVRKVRQSRRLQVLASTDELTGALNRRAVMAFAEQAHERAAQDRATLSLLLIDVDHFKRINDQHGHLVGDRVLRQLAQTLQAGLRAGDRLGRIGGEEFMVVLPNTAGEDATQIADRMRVQCGRLEVAAAEGGVARFSISAGVASTGGRNVPLAALIGEADAALYAAKSGGRNAVITFKPPAIQPALGAA
jgi:diguanylate cyclase (GGDEF)-like protein